VAALLGVLRHRLVGHSLIFIAGEILNKALPFLLLPVLTRALTTADYGVTATFAAVLSVLGVLVGLSSHGAVSVAFFRLDRPALGRQVAAVLLVLATSTAASFLIMAAIAGRLSAALDVPVRWLLLAVVLAGAQFATQINLVLWQCERKPAAYAGYQISQTALNALVTILLVVRWHWGWRGQLTGQAVAVLTFGVGSLIVLARRRYLSHRPTREDVRDVVAFGVPLVPHALAGWVLTGVDRFLLTSIVGVAATGLYAVGYQMAMVLGVLAAAFNRAWVPYLFEQLGTIDDAGRRRLVRLIYALFGAFLLAAIVMGVLVTPLADVFLGERFHDASRFVFWIALGFAFDGMYYLVVNQLFYVKRTGPLVWITLAVGIAHVALSSTLIRLQGPIGAARAMAISFGFQFLLVWMASARFCPLPWSLRRAAARAA
jgi:O-antigen/teichoic acid export membrane protein